MHIHVDFYIRMTPQSKLQIQTVWNPNSSHRNNSHPYTSAPHSSSRSTWLLVLVNSFAQHPRQPAHHSPLVSDFSQQTSLPTLCLNLLANPAHGPTASSAVLTVILLWETRPSYFHLPMRTLWLQSGLILLFLFPLENYTTCSRKPKSLYFMH